MQPIDPGPRNQVSARGHTKQRTPGPEQSFPCDSTPGRLELAPEH
ncbi:hypothetical protein [Streptomyces sp. NBC_00388]